MVGRVVGLAVGWGELPESETKNPDAGRPKSAPHPAFGHLLPTVWGEGLSSSLHARRENGCRASLHARREKDYRIALPAMRANGLPSCTPCEAGSARSRQWICFASIRLGASTMHSFSPHRGEKVPEGRMSNCVACQAIFGSPTHGWPSRSMALRMVSNFRMHATNATFLALPAARKRWWKTRSVGLKRTALSVAM